MIASPISGLKNTTRTWCWPLFLLLFMTASCKKDYQEENKGNTPLQLTTIATSIVLEQKNDNADGVVFNWTAGSNQGTNASISYTLKIDKQGSNFANALTADLGKSNLTKKYTVKELNDLLLTKWNVAPGVAANMQARVIATVAGDAAPADSSAIINISITPYKPVTETLYLLGDATPKGWNADQATKMSAITAQPGGFTWQGPLTAGDFKLITTLGQFLPSYNKGASNSHLLYRTLDSDPDEKFHISATGVYNVTVSLLDLTISITEADEPPYTRLFMLGDAVPTGWNIDNPAEMRVDSSNLFVFTYNEILSAGEFKIPVATGNFGTDYYMPLVNHQALTETGVQWVAGGSPDLKWQVTNPGPYKIKLDLQAMTMQIKPFTPYTKIWMVGDATPAGWNIDNPTALVADPGNPNIFTFTGPLNAGEFKFPLATGNWACDYFMPVINGSAPGSTQMKFIASGSPDNKWKITEAGNYKITINQLYETISIEKQ